jgi:hypothetical protein
LPETVWFPTPRPDVEYVATPPDRVTGPPASAPSIRNWIVPLGVPAPGATGPTVAVKTTLSPGTLEPFEEATATEAPALPTVCPSSIAPVVGV